jgi:citrate synthase
MKTKINLKIAGLQSEMHNTLLECCIDCHQQAAFNLNASSAAFQNALIASGRVENGIASAILTLGINHGPITEARDVYRNWGKADFEVIKKGVKVPGFGNSFFREGIDPAFEPLDSLMRNEFGCLSSRIDELTSWMRDYKPLYPNAALYTAAVCEAVQVKYGCESMVFIMARIPSWIGL